MRREKKKRLKAKGWKIGNAKDFLGSSAQTFMRLAGIVRGPKDLSKRKGFSRS